MSAKKRYTVAKTGGNNLGGPALTWWIVLGPGVGRTHYVTKREALEVARVANLAFVEGRITERDWPKRTRKKEAKP